MWIKKGMDLLLKLNQDKFLQKKHYRNVKKQDRSWQSLTHRPSSQYYSNILLVPTIAISSFRGFLDWFHQKEVSE